MKTNINTNAGFLVSLVVVLLTTSSISYTEYNFSELFRGYVVIGNAVGAGLILLTIDLFITTITQSFKPVQSITSFADKHSNTLLTVALLVLATYITCCYTAGNLVSYSFSTVTALTYFISKPFMDRLLMLTIITKTELILPHHVIFA